jgi:hypothetical protein
MRATEGIAMKSEALRSVALVIMWLVLVVQLGMILGELSTLERVIRNIDGTTVNIANNMSTGR